MTPLQALQAATSGPARFLRRSDIGGIAPGMRADLVLLGADPLADIRNTRVLRGVVMAGRYFDEAGLKGLLEQAAEAAETY
jgi:imidazolonepropionase-like amidohydrolase